MKQCMLAVRVRRAEWHSSSGHMCANIHGTAKIRIVLNLVNPEHVEVYKCPNPGNYVETM